MKCLTYWNAYLETLARFDKKGDGVPCGNGWISKSKKCSKNKAATTPAEAKQRGVEKAKQRIQSEREFREQLKRAPQVREQNKMPKPKAPPKRYTSNPKPLTGSDKQIDWANKIRRAAIEQVDGWIQSQQLALAFLPTKFLQNPAAVQQMSFAIGDAMTAAADNQTSASWWINERGRTGEPVRFNELLKQVPRGLLELTAKRHKVGSLLRWPEQTEKARYGFTVE